MSTYLSLSDLVKSKGPDGNMLTIAEVLEREVPIVGDAPWIEANDSFSNLSTRRSGLPAGTWRKFYEGVSPERSQKTNVRDVIGMLESESVADCKLIDAYPNPAQARSDEDIAFAQGFSQTMASAMLYSDTITAPEKFTGFAARLNGLAATTNVLNSGGTGSDLTSIFVVNWSPQTCFMAYPKGSMAGLVTEDLGRLRVDDANSKSFMAYVTRFGWDAGLVVKDPRSIGRIANIESAGASNTFDEDDLITLLNRMTVGPMAKIYMNETVQTQAEILGKDKANMNWTSVEDAIGGKPILRFRGIPVRKIDSTILLNTETALT